MTLKILQKLTMEIRLLPLCTLIVVSTALRKSLGLRAASSPKRRQIELLWGTRILCAIFGERRSTAASFKRVP
jgi:hypothetical protein